MRVIVLEKMIAAQLVTLSFALYLWTEVSLPHS